jgi:hypothetical protein
LKAKSPKLKDHGSSFPFRIDWFPPPRIFALCRLNKNFFGNREGIYPTVPNHSQTRFTKSKCFFLDFPVTDFFTWSKSSHSPQDFLSKKNQIPFPKLILTGFLTWSKRFTLHRILCSPQDFLPIKIYIWKPRGLPSDGRPALTKQDSQRSS